MDFLKTIIIKLLPKNIPKPLGRWRIELCNKKINDKIDLSNEDHCGPCGQYALVKNYQSKNSQLVVIKKTK
jgi:hypothetical protein